MKIFKKYINSIVISIMIILLVAIGIFRINYAKKESKYISQEGVLDLRQSNLDKGEIIKLDGEWEFYSGKLIEPSQDFSKERKEYVNVPGNWEAYLKGQGLENGSGTYRLTIKVPKDMIYAIKTRTIRTSHKIYLNGEKITQMGNPSLDKEKARAESKYKLGVGSSLDEEIELIAHISSINYRSGGILKSLEIGSSESIIKSDNRNLALDVLLVAICLTLSLYFFAMYLQRSKESYLAYFSGMNLFMALYLSTMNEQVLSLIYNYKASGRICIQVLSMNLAAFCFLRFMHCFFEEYSNKKIINSISTYMILILTVAIPLLGKEKMFVLPFIQTANMLSIAIAYIYTFYILIKAIKLERDSVGYILTIIVSMASYWTILFIKIFSEIDLGNIPIFLILLMMFSVAALMTNRLQLDYQEARDLSKKFEKYDGLRDKFFENMSLRSQ